MPDLTLHVQPGFQVPGRSRCFSGTPFAIKVERALHWKRLPFGVHEVGWEEREALFARIGPARKLPILVYDGVAIEDSGDIVQLLEARHPEPSLTPAAPRDRALAHFLEEWADEVFYFVALYDNTHMTGPERQARAYWGEGAGEERVRAAREVNAETLSRQGMGRYPPAKVMADLERALDHIAILTAETGFAAGPALSSADLALFGHFYRRCAGTHLEVERRILARPSLCMWMERVDELTAGPAH